MTATIAIVILFLSMLGACWAAANLDHPACRHEDDAEERGVTVWCDCGEPLHFDYRDTTYRNN